MSSAARPSKCSPTRRSPFSCNKGRKGECVGQPCARRQSRANESGSHPTLCWREMDSNHQYLDDKPRFVQRLRLRRVFDESVATATFFAPFGDHRPKLIRAMRHATRPTMCRSKVMPVASARSTIAPSRWLPARWARAQAFSPNSRRPPRLRCDREPLANRLDSSERLCTSQLHAGNGRGRASTGIR